MGFDADEHRYSQATHHASTFQILIRCCSMASQLQCKQEQLPVGDVLVHCKVGKDRCEKTTFYQCFPVCRLAILH